MISRWCIFLLQHHIRLYLFVEPKAPPLQAFMIMMTQRRNSMIVNLLKHSRTRQRDSFRRSSLFILHSSRWIRLPFWHLSSGQKFVFFVLFWLKSNVSNHLAWMHERHVTVVHFPTLCIPNTCPLHLLSGPEFKKVYSFFCVVALAKKLKWIRGSLDCENW